MNLKKAFVVIASIALLSLPMFAQENVGGKKQADISYVMAPVYKVMEASDAYIVIYQKFGAKVGSVTIPKDWVKYRPNEVRKCTIRPLPPKLNPYITVVNKDGDFEKVILTVPSSKKDSVWGRAANSKTDLDGIEKIELATY